MTKHAINNRAMRLALLSALSTGLFAYGVTVHAGTQTATIALTATVTASCSITGTTIDFGNSINLSGNTDTTSTLQTTCTNGSAYTIGLNAGAASGATVTTRKLTHSNGTDTLNYSLSSVALGGTNWGDTVGTGAYSGVGTGAQQTVTVFSRIPTGQNAIAGTYTDTITATIEF